MVGKKKSPCYNLQQRNNLLKQRLSVDKSLDKTLEAGQPGWLSGLAPPSAQGLILETPGIKSHVGLLAWSLLLPLPVSLPLSVCLS